MIQLREREIREKYRSLPKTLQSILNSPAYSDEVRETIEKSRMSEEDAQILAASVGLVFLGFIKPQNLFNEINEYLDADEKVVTEVIRGINRQVFIPLHKELEDLYKLETHIEEELEKEFLEPATKVEVQKAKPKEETKVVSEKPPAIQQKPEEKKPPQETEIKPFVIHKEERQESAVEDKKFKGFDFPSGFFRKEGGRVPPSEPVRVRVEVPGKEVDKNEPVSFGERGSFLGKLIRKKKDDGKSLDKAPLNRTRGKQNERVVHYSEYRTPLTPFGKPEEEIIDLQTFTEREPPPSELQPKTNGSQHIAEEKKTPKVKIPEAKKPAASSNEASLAPSGREPLPQKLPKNETPLAPKNSKGPSIEGNIIDLKNL